ncbi:MAG TPA: hypothetical protein VFX22_05555 [Candidatus Kapabacteria bacterium]|nr:hypothetical protein [Candidatus Kapabacteria bacterium]
MIRRYLLAFFLFPILPLFASAQRHHPVHSRAANLPKVGTVIINTYFVTDSSGALVPKTKADPKLVDDTLRVIRSGVALMGRSNCVELADADNEDTSIISYDKNGDVYMRAIGKDISWNLLPFGLPPAKIIREKLPNDTGNLLLKEYDMPHSRTWEVLGTDTASFDGKIYNCIKLQIVDIREYQGREWEQGMLYWYAPEIGYFIRMNFGWNGPYFLNQQLKEYRETSNE